MEQFSHLNRPGSISHSSSGVWRIQKKRKTTDRNARKKDQGSQEEKETPDVTFEVMPEEASNADADKTEAQTDEVAVESDKKPGKKIDLTI